MKFSMLRAEAAVQARQSGFWNRKLEATKRFIDVGATRVGGGVGLGVGAGVGSGVGEGVGSGVGVGVGSGLGVGSGDGSTEGVGSGVGVGSAADAMPGRTTNANAAPRKPAMTYRPSTAASGCAKDRVRRMVKPNHTEASASGYPLESTLALRVGAYP
jgi:hypothetical protein